MPQIQCTILFFFPLFPLHVCFLQAQVKALISPQQLQYPSRPSGGQCSARNGDDSRSMGGLMRNICINKIWKEENLFPTVNYLIDCLLKLH